MEIFLVPFSLLDLVLLSPVYAYFTWFLFRKMMRRKRKFTGFMTWAIIIHATIIPFFWLLHSMGAFIFVESDKTTFDPVVITGHVTGFIITYVLFCGGLTMLLLAAVKWRSA